MKKNYKTYLLHGITGSGKTEVYLAAIEEVIKKGKQAIVLIPEIALTYQTVTRFTKRFGEARVDSESTLSKVREIRSVASCKKGGCGCDHWTKICIVCAISEFGLIVIDEEHEGSYKSEQTPKYHAREVAIKKAQMEGASVILGFGNTISGQL